MKNNSSKKEMDRINANSKEFIFKLDRECDAVEASIELLLLHEKRVSQEFSRRKRMLNKHRDSIKDAKKSIMKGDALLFSLEETYAASPELQKLIANPNRGMK